MNLLEKWSYMKKVFLFRPLFTIGITFFSIFAAVMEGVGLSFLLPIMEVAQQGIPENPGMMMSIFLGMYNVLNIPFELIYIIIGAMCVMGLRFASSFMSSWIQEYLRESYIRSLRVKTYNHAMNARIALFDREGSEKILNTLLTEAKTSGRVIRRLVQIGSDGALMLIYASVILYISPVLTLLALSMLGGITIVLRNIIEPAYNLGSKVADANEDMQKTAQAGTQGIREAKLFNITDALKSVFTRFASDYQTSTIAYRRNKHAINSFFNLSSAVLVLGFIYLGFTWANLSMTQLGIFLFAIFRLSPLASSVNKLYYRLNGELPHLVRTHEFLDKLQDTREATGDRKPPDTITQISVKDVSFTYQTDESDEQVLDDVSLHIKRGEFVALVGPSGAGKSTITSLLARFYEPDAGTIRVNGTPLQQFELDAWREKLAVVRQDPYIFNDTLAHNILLYRDRDQERLDEVCQIACVHEFFDTLGEGYDTVLGDQGVRLSGGQKQRVALARALYREAEVLILDEATSDLDTGIEQRVQQAIESMDRDHLMLTIAHRLSTVRNADRIYTLENGQVIEQGVHQTLLEKNGTYADLYASQSNT
jgi:subfamily B ATP-binding cassette protein MsbA